ncbi:ABC transporter ATP-binding protein [Haloarchaeobius amylolyticus]|uniref:ABC transporter ATP-binding protein n=1 Tax=Haloarchaeobius amylolyticus TaxID=1198296 RepID=UPI00226F59B4|nr:ABC transporter ATP-binding protein [Haloarchaeobius amylolyticus]
MIRGDEQLAIAASGLRKVYGSVVAVEGLDLAVPRGTVYGFLGPNGAGKTTTMGMLTTLVPPTAGTASIAGVSIADREGVKPHVGYLPDEPPLYDEFTAREQLGFVADLRQLEPAAAATRIDALLDQVGLADVADERIESYSRGTRQKVGLVQAMLHEPNVLFLDEPTSGLDPRAAREVLDLIDGLADGGTTVFLSSHALSVVEELADVVGVLHQGRLVAEGTPAELTQRVADGERSLERVFLDLTADQSEAPV